MKTEYWCAFTRHWAKEVRYHPIIFTSMPTCEKCYEGDWEDLESVVREVEEPRYVATLQMSGDWNVTDSLKKLSMDYRLTESQATEIAALRNKWWEGSNDN